MRKDRQKWIQEMEQGSCENEGKKEFVSLQYIIKQNVNLAKIMGKLVDSVNRLNKSTINLSYVLMGLMIVGVIIAESSLLLK